jgi:Late embryogenesis abundant protein
MADRVLPGPHSTAFGSPVIHPAAEPGTEPDPEPDPNLNRHPWLPAPETYIVQVPKDQIYRVPPPENAVLVERYRNQVSKSTGRSPVLTCLGWLCASILTIILLCLIIFVAFIATVRPGKPRFAMDKVRVKNPTDARPEYDFTMSVRNPSASMSYSYEKDGTAVLSYGGVNIAKGKTPMLNQNSKNTTTVKIVTKGLKMVVPKKIAKALKGSKDNMQLKLMLEIGVSAKAWGLDLNGMHVTVSCDLTSKGLAKEPRIETQSCETQIKT